MILEVVQSKCSLTWYDPLGPRMCVLELMNGQMNSLSKRTRENFFAVSNLKQTLKTNNLTTFVIQNEQNKDKYFRYLTSNNPMQV